ncbi:MAG: hypothetical protein QF790_07790 [Gammaproteobacteria bacterium]|nr:hypothetical protein [Gammaproteobacteria bacterium]MDP6617048.1 hypothetical protein [Gammaproteobacteria bacterium]MDP6695257.1 hypothetical protein [Gammaproteobacteria bacterium]
MNKLTLIRTIVTLGSLLALAGTSYAGHKPVGTYSPESEQFSVNAKVLNVEPLTRIVQITTPQEVCWNEPVHYQARGYESNTPKVVGGILGGAFGNKFGGGSGKKLMTAAGMLLGASIGRDVAYQNSHRGPSQVSYEQVCEIEQVTHEEERADGFRVTYEYGGRQFVAYTREAPGNYIRLHVLVEPAAI